MFNRQDSITIVGNDVIVEGSIKTKHTAEIFGAIVCNNERAIDSGKSVIVHESASVQGSIYAEEKVCVYGSVQGSIESKGIVSLGENANVQGDIVTTTFVAAAGSTINGRVQCKKEEGGN